MIKFEPSVLSTLYNKVTAVVQARKSTGVEVDFKVYNTLPGWVKDDPDKTLCQFMTTDGKD